ncbi:ATP-grasp fold amidoligase family protein [Alkalilacustris brevis]|uniref:ATP-grasp fold amidoligase family protein n=1 Tax=Alkalilacustris brevis TaxID=2026338 RepID=UPI0013905D52|nr:ATP-grasp fold amidoligase family protein [Alkalilacustris brevis]
MHQEAKLILAHLDRVLGAPLLKRRFRRRHGYALDLKNPQTFSEKIQWRKLKDDNPLFPILSNKYLVRDYVVSRLGQERAQELLVPLLQYVEDPDDLDFDTLPASYVIKATHGSGMNLIVEDSDALDKDAARALMKKWLIRYHRLSAHEWAYTKTRRGILVEEMVADPAELHEVKLQFFNGDLRSFYINGLENGSKFRTFFDAERKVLNVRSPSVPRNPDALLPNNIDEMIEFGKPLAEDLDFVRVDLLCTAERFYIGELTLFSGSGMAVLDPPKYNEELGSYWTLPTQRLGGDD